MCLCATQCSTSTASTYTPHTPATREQTGAEATIPIGEQAIASIELREKPVDRLARPLRYGVAVESQQIIEAATRTLAELAEDPVKIVLFGSRARGDAGPDSDYDFLVVERELKDRRAEMLRLRRALRPLGVPCDVLVVSERYAEEWGGALNSTMHSALSEGRVLHAAA